MDTKTDPPPTTADTARSSKPIRPALSEHARLLLAQRTHGFPGWVVLIELFIGLGWLRAATEKLIDPAWWRGEALASFLTEHEGLSLVWYRPFVDLAVSPHLMVTALVVLVAQLAAGASLISGRHRMVGLSVGIFLNASFLAAGAVNPSVFYLLSQGAVMLWLAEQTSWAGIVRRLFTVRATALVLAAVSLPFIRTVEPATVIDDPAAMFVCGGLLSVIAVNVALQNRLGRPPRANPSDGASQVTGAVSS